MATLNVKVPDGMDADLEAYLEEHPHYLNKSELVRDALRHLLASPPWGSDVLREVAAGRRRVARGEGPVDLSGLPTFRDDDPRASEHHDALRHEGSGDVDEG